MKEDNKEIEIQNGAFDLKIHWNRGVMSTQAAILLGAGALFICSNSKPVRSLCLVCIVLDAVAVLFYLLSTARKNEERTEEVESEPSADGEEPANVEHNRSGNSSTRTTNKTIKAKVPIPNPSAERVHGRHVESVPSAAEPEPMPIPQPAELPAQEVPVTDAEDATETMAEDWSGFF